MGFDAPWHWVILALIVIALFGARRLPDAARSLGQSLRIFKTEIKNDPGTSGRPELTAQSGDTPAATAETPNGSRPEVNGSALAAPQDAAGLKSTS